MTPRGITDANADAASLAASFVAAPFLSEADQADRRLSEWMSDLSTGQTAELESVFERFPRARQILTGIAVASPYLFDLVRSDVVRTLKLLRCEPEHHLASLIEDTRQGVWATSTEAQVMQLLRRTKAEAALLIALCDIGGVWPVMRVTQALTDLAVTSVKSALHFLLRQEVSRGRMLPGRCC
jgi:glutamate-ammonia-ligase adenylyltransferase